MPNWFVSDRIIKHDLGDGEWIEYKSDISYEDYSEMLGSIDMESKVAQMKLARPILKAVLVNWSLKDNEGNQIEFSKDKIDKLSTQAILLLSQPIIETFFVEKKNWEQSPQSTKKESKEKE